MNIIQQLSQTVTPPFLSSQVSSLAIPIEGSGLEDLLEQYYAILSARLNDNNLISRLDGHMNGVSQVLFPQVWINKAERDIIVQELAETYHLDEPSVTLVIQEATPTVYNTLKNQAGQQGLPLVNYLSGQFVEIRRYLPAWVGQVIPMSLLTGQPEQNPIPTPDTIFNNMPDSMSNAMPNDSLMSTPQYPDNELPLFDTPFDDAQVNNAPLNNNTHHQSAQNQPIPNQNNHLQQGDFQQGNLQPNNSQHHFQQQNSQQSQLKNDITQNHPAKNSTITNQKNAKQKNSTNAILKIGLPIFALLLISVGTWVWYSSKQIQSVQATQTETTKINDNNTTSNNNSSKDNATKLSSLESQHPTTDSTQSQPTFENVPESKDNSQVIEYNFEEGSNQPTTTQGQSVNQPISNAIATNSGSNMVFEFEEPVNEAEVAAMRELDELVNTTIYTDKVVGEQIQPSVPKKVPTNHDGVLIKSPDNMSNIERSLEIHSELDEYPAPLESNNK